MEGTGVESCEDFVPNLAKLFNNTSYADPVFVNIPGNLLGDLQTSSEYVSLRSRESLGSREINRSQL